MAEFIPGPFTVSVGGTNERKLEIATVYGVERQPTEDGRGQEWVHILADWKPDIALPSSADDGKNRLATAYLFAAAPDMYQALSDLRMWFAGEDDDTQNQDIVLAADAALKKARNEVAENDIQSRHARVMAVIEQGTDADFDLSALATAVIKECFR